MEEFSEASLEYSGQYRGPRRRLGLTRRGRVNKEAYKEDLLKTFRIFGRPFGGIMADLRGSRHDG